MKNPDKITLINKHLGQVEFDFSHAEAIVKHEYLTTTDGTQVNWMPDQKSNYQIKDGALIPTTNNGTLNEAEEQG